MKRSILQGIALVAVVSIVFPILLGSEPATAQKQQSHPLAPRVTALEADVAVLQASMVALLADATPTGTVVAHAGAATPPGWLLCDGSEVDRTTFAALFAAIGISHGDGDSVTTFNLPDYRGRFLRGVDGGVGRDPDAGARTAMNVGGNTGDLVGSVQAAATGLPTAAPFTTTFAGQHNHVNPSFPSTTGKHTHGVPGIFAVSGGSRGDATGSPKWSNFNGAVTTDFSGEHAHAQDGSHVHSVDTGGDAETRPLNAHVNWIIKAN